MKSIYEISPNKNNLFYVFVTVLTVGTLSATDYIWSGQNSNWSNAASSGWNGGPPIAGDSATINSGRVQVTGAIDSAVPISIGSGGQLYLNANNLTVSNSITLNGITSGGAILSGDLSAGNMTVLSGQITLASTSNIASW